MLSSDAFWVILINPEKPSKVTGLHVEILDINSVSTGMILQSAPVTRITPVGDRLDWLPPANT